MVGAVQEKIRFDNRPQHSDSDGVAEMGKIL